MVLWSIFLLCFTSTSLMLAYTKYDNYNGNYIVLKF